MRRSVFHSLGLVAILTATLISAPNRPETTDRTTYINANDILMFVTNEGSFGQDITNLFGREYGTFYPYTTNADIENGTTKWPLYSAGLWLGGRVNGEIRVTVSEYQREYTPGPMADSTFVSDAYTSDVYRVYKLHADSGAFNPNTDYLEWPTDQGAPVDELGRPLIRFDQTLWSVFNDADTARHTGQVGGTDPLGIEVQQTVWASDSIGAERVIYMQYKLYNRGTNEIDDFCISLWMDAEIGWREDDLAGCDTLIDVIYQYNADNDDGEYGSQPPAFGARILYGPMVPTGSDEDTAYFDGHLVPGYENLEMSACATYINGADPANATESYCLMRGLMVDGNPFASGTSYRYPGNPISGTGDVDIYATDKKQLGSFGPISFNPGDSQFVMVKLAVGQGHDRLSSLSDLMATLAAPDRFITDVPSDLDASLPDGYALEQNYPNPFNPATIISYRVPTRTRVDIAVYNVLGQRVRTLESGTVSAGSHTTIWDGTDEKGERLSSGVYFYRARLGEHSISRKMLLLK